MVNGYLSDDLHAISISVSGFSLDVASATALFYLPDLSGPEHFYYSTDGFDSQGSMRLSGGRRCSIQHFLFLLLNGGDYE